ncbi:hypothetical protein PshuTeo2_05440 [Pseudomonas hunanensis]|uniref:hypothetical protein n=1 Tax=Pseudomonas hunanensis TaxID=1247546 RepID=UPI002AA0CE15|nr:hypothetical protein [Pseudomonas hunanensis]MDY7070522.1 hypothetical protein [Pseudomonas hunanensis]
MTNDNPAARMLAILQSIHDIPGNKPCKAAWSSAFRIDAGDDSSLMIRLSQLMSMSVDAVLLMNERFPALRDQTTQWHIQLITALTSQQLAGSIQTFTNGYTRKHNDFLKVIDQMIGISAPAEIDLSLINEFREGISNLINETLESQLEPKAKSYLVKALRRILAALDDYRLTGVVPVVESIELVAGHMFTDSQFKNSMSSDFGNRVFSVIGAIADSIAIATGAPATMWKEIGNTLKGFIEQS